MQQKKIAEYVIEKKLGEGLYAKSFLAQNKNGLKVILKNFKKRLWLRNCPKNYYEAVILSQLDHLSIPQFLGVINEKDFYAYILEYKPGYTLYELLFEQRYIFSNEEIRLIFSRLLDITEYMHNKNIVHRDIRLPNIILNKEEISLIDFGLARYLDNGMYSADMDFSYLGDVLLFLLYSQFRQKGKKSEWYNELDITEEQKCFLKRMLRMEKSFSDISEVKEFFKRVFY